MPAEGSALTPPVEALTRALDCLARHYPWGTAQLGAPPEADGPWLALPDLADSGCRAPILARMATEYGDTTPEPVLGNYLFRNALDAPLRVAGYLFIAERRVPRLRDNVLLRNSDWLQHGRLLRAELYVLPDDPLAGEPGIEVVPDLGALADGLFWEIETAFAPVLEAFSSLRYVAPANAWGSILDALVEGTLIAGRTGLNMEAAWARWDAALAGRKLPVRRRPRHCCYEINGKRHDVAVRAGCCLWFMTPAAQGAKQRYCTTCYLLSDPDREQSLIAYEQKKAATADLKADSH